MWSVLTVLGTFWVWHNSSQTGWTDVGSKLHHRSSSSSIFILHLLHLSSAPTSLHLLPSASSCFSSSALDFPSSLLNRTWLFTSLSLSRSSWQDVQEFIAARIISQSVSIKTRLSTKVCVRRNNRRTETEAEPSDCDLQLTFTWHTPIDPDQYSLHSHDLPLTVSLWWCELLNHSQVVWRLHPLWQSDSCSL